MSVKTAGMRYLLIIYLLFCADHGYAQQQKFYRELDGDAVKQYNITDTILQKGSFTVTKRTNALKGLKTYYEVVEILIGLRKKYFLLNYDAHLINDSTIVVMSPPFKSTSTEGSIMKNGIWVYTDFYADKTNGTAGNPEEYTMKFIVDSMPPDWDYKRLPVDEGIYFYKNGTLKKVSKEQSEEKFGAQEKDGFYFIPKSGRLYTKYDIRSIK